MRLLKKGEVFLAEWVDLEDALPPVGKDYGIGVGEPVLVHVSTSPGVSFGTFKIATYYSKEKKWVGQNGEDIGVSISPGVREYLGIPEGKADCIVTHWMRLPDAPFIPHPNPSGDSR